MVAPSFDSRRARTLRRVRRLLPRGVHEPCALDIAAPRVGEDLCVQQRAQVHEPLILRRPAVSEDLLVRLLPPSGVARGKQFAAGPVVEVPREDRNAGEAKPRQGKPRKSYKEHRLPNDTLRQTMTVWDLLLPLLHPPLPLGAGAESCDLPHPLYRYQVDGIVFLRDARSALLADEMGTGKTVMSTVAMRLLFRSGALRRALVVVPLSVVGVWDRHLAEWAPELGVTVVHGDARTRWADWRCPAHVWITTYDVLRGDLCASGRNDPLLPVDIARSFDLVLLDEAQSIKNAASGRTRAVLQLAPARRWALSGTPIENRIEDLQSLFDFLKPRLLPQEGLTPALAAELIAPYVKRRTKKDVMRELPPKIRQDEWLELDPAQRQAYQIAEDRARSELEELGDRVTRVHVFTRIAELKRICNFAPGNASSPKLRATVEKVEEIAAGGKKVLIFTQWVDEGVLRIAEALRPFGVVTFDGSMDAAQREAAVKTFREDPTVTAFVATVKSAGVGLTLTEASYVIHFDHWWNPAWMWQAEDRAHRRGQTEPVNVYSLWMTDTIEARVHALLEQKGMLHEEIIDGLSEGADGGRISVQEWLTTLGVPGPRRRDTSG
ncbi:MAG: DEAD/DEAH box helicase [Planctomycetota bacterium]